MFFTQNENDDVDKETDKKCYHTLLGEYKVKVALM